MNVADGLSLAFKWQGERFQPIEAIESAALAVLPRKPTLEQIQRLERLLLAQPQAAVDAKWHFGPGVAMREGIMPAGTIATGHMHATEHLSILAQGTITVWTEEGMKTLTAPAIVKSMPGAKRVGYAHDDVVWITVHATDETDPDKLFELLTIPPGYPEIGGNA